MEQYSVPTVIERPSAQATLRSGFNWPIIGAVLALKAFILIFGGWSYQTLTNQPLATLRNWLEIWNRWDAPHYLDLAQYGYHAVDVGEIRLFIVFYPLFPWLTRIFGLITGDYLIGAFIVSAVASVIAALLLHKLIAIDEPDSTARSAVWFFLIFPTSYFLHIGYTESVFIACMLGCFWAARRQHWLLAGVLGALACLARVNGLVLILALGVEALHQYWTTRRWQWQWLWIGLIGLGFGGYLWLNYDVFGNALHFLTVQRQHWYKSLDWPWNGIWQVIRSIWWRPPADAQMIGVQELIYIVLSLVCTIISAFKLRPSYTAWMAGNWLLLTSTSFIMSTPRYVLILFPMFVLFARAAAENRRWGTVITVWSLMCMALFIGLFVQNKWAF